MRKVYELTGSLSNIVVETDLLFPNVQTCVAVVAVASGQLVGAHVTLADRGRLLKVAQKLDQLSQGTPTVYVIGPVRGYNLGPLTDIGRVYFHECPGFIDVSAAIVGGAVKFGKRATGSTGAFEDIPLTSFY